MKTKQVDQNCASILFRKADQDLSAAYALAIASMRKTDLKLAEERRGYEKALSAAQHAWEVFRDAQCELVSFSERGGSGAGVAKAGCAIDMTNERTKFLKWVADYYDPSNRQENTP